ncbi:MAG TPA: hypothetical protein VM686_25685 [Polyangiaceae bacterium]|nr:hypothetical protein [Polyangiaceae bacterium]
MKLRQSLLAALVIVACGRELPSSTPLGGILDDGLSQGYTPDRRARETDAGEVSEVAESKETDAGAPDAAVAKQDVPDSGTVDAGAVDAASADAAVKWAGEYVGSDLQVTRIQGRPDIRQPDDKARTRVEDKGSGRIALVIVNSLNGDTICSLNASTQGASATIDRGQNCFSAEEVDVTVESGSADLKGDRLIFDVKASLEGVVGDDKIEGSVDYHFDGRRK